jgi:hypothetical protein
LIAISEHPVSSRDGEEGVRPFQGSTSLPENNSLLLQPMIYVNDVARRAGVPALMRLAHRPRAGNGSGSKTKEAGARADAGAGD